MRGGNRQELFDSLPVIRDRFQKEFAQLPNKYKALEKPETFSVALSPGLEELQKRVVHEVQEEELGES